MFNLPTYRITPSAHPVKCPPQCPPPRHETFKNKTAVNYFYWKEWWCPIREKINVLTGNFLHNYITIVFLRFYLFIKYIIYLFMRHRERGRDAGRGRSRLHAGSPMWDSIPGLQIVPWAEGKHSTGEPTRHPNKYSFSSKCKLLKSKLFTCLTIMLAI